MFSFLPGALPQATVKVAFGQNLGPQLRNSEDIRRLASKDAIAGRPHQRRSGSPTSPACQPGRHAAGLLSARTTKLTGWPPISLPFKSDRIGHSGPAISSGAEPIGFLLTTDASSPPNVEWLGLQVVYPLRTRASSQADEHELSCLACTGYPLS